MPVQRSSQYWDYESPYVLWNRLVSVKPWAALPSLTAWELVCKEIIHTLSEENGWDQCHPQGFTGGSQKRSDGISTKDPVYCLCGCIGALQMNRFPE